MRTAARFLYPVLICFLLLASQAKAAESRASMKDEIGYVIAVSGDVNALINGQTRALSPKKAVFRGDTVRTGTDGKIQIVFLDGTVLNMGNNSRIEMQEFVDAGTESVFKAHLVLGAARVITGRLTRQNPSGFTMTTPDATVGIRGTAFVVTATPLASSIYVLVSEDHDVMVNNRQVAQEFKAVVKHGGIPEITPMTDGERQNLAREVDIAPMTDKDKRDAMKLLEMKGHSADMP